MQYLAQNCQGFTPHVAACRATWSPRASLLHSRCSAQKQSQQSSFASQNSRCNRSINPCAQSGRRTWTVDKWHIEHYGGKVHANSVAEYSERLVVTCLGVNGVTRTMYFPGIVLEAGAPPAAKVLRIM